MRAAEIRPEAVLPAPQHPPKGGRRPEFWTSGRKLPAAPGGGQLRGPSAFHTLAKAGPRPTFDSAGTAGARAQTGFSAPLRALAPILLLLEA
jgi:hypothetical protein